MGLKSLLWGKPNRKKKDQKNLSGNKEEKKIDAWRLIITPEDLETMTGKKS